MTKDQISLLLYLETRAVDYGGTVAMEKMNKEDLAQTQKWNDEGFLGFGRICFKDHSKRSPTCTHWVELSEEAWKAAHAERRARAARLWAERPWRKTSEKNEE